MPILRKKDKWKRFIVFGTGSIKPDRDGNIYTESEPDKFTGLCKLRFKVNGGYKRSADNSHWLRQDVNCYVWENHPLAQVVKKLVENDVVDIMGIMKVSKYTSLSTGKEKKYYEVNLEKCTVLYHFNGELSTDSDYIDYDTDEFGDF